MKEFELELDRSIDNISQNIVDIMNESFEMDEHNMKVQERKILNLETKLEKANDKNKELQLKIKEKMHYWLIVEQET